MLHKYEVEENFGIGIASTYPMVLVYTLQVFWQELIRDQVVADYALHSIGEEWKIGGRSVILFTTKQAGFQ